MTDRFPLGVCVALLGVAGLLTGCGGGGDDPTSTPRITVIVMRHCIRSTPENGIYDVPGLEYYNNYSDTPWPSFGVEAYHCTQRGLDIIKGTGSWLRAKGDLPQPVQVVADAVQRDNVTAIALLAGLFTDGPQPFAYNGEAFHAAENCPSLSAEETAKAIAAQQEAIPRSEPEFASLLLELAEIMNATGGAVGWNESGCVFNSGSLYLDGACSAASDFVERFLMEEGAGLKVAWGRMNLDRLPKLLHLHSWYRQIMTSTPQLVARKQSSILRAVSEALNGVSGDKQDVTRIFVGHDTQLNALNGALSLLWDAKPFPVNATVPGSALRFDRIGDDVTLSYIFPTNYSDEGEKMGTMTSVPATIRASGTNTILVHDLQRLFEESSFAACANNWTFDDTQRTSKRTDAFSDDDHRVRARATARAKHSVVV